MSVGAVNKQTGGRIPTAGMPAIDDALDLTSVNPVQNAIITAALANKQDKNDNSLDTEAKTIVGAINEHEGDIDSLKSGLTNLNSNLIDVNVALSVPDGTGKNLIPLTLDYLKSNNTYGTWNDNVYSFRGIDYTILTSNGVVTSITITGTAVSDNDSLIIIAPVAFMQSLAGKSLILNGCNGGSPTTYRLEANKYDGTNSCHSYNGDSDPFTPTSSSDYLRLLVIRSAQVNNVVFYPMLRLASVSDSTFAPYIPSVESRIEAVESGLTNVATEVNRRYYYNTTHALNKNGGYVEIDVSGLSTGKGYLIMCCGKSNAVWRYVGVLYVLEANGAVLYDLLTCGSLSVSVENGTYTVKATNNNIEHNQNINVKIIG